MGPAGLEDVIAAAFAGVEHPGDGCLLRGVEGEEPHLVQLAFAGKTDWRGLEASFLDQAPDGYSSALNFLSEAAFRFYLPAYLIADIGGGLSSVDPVFHLTFGLTDAERLTPVNPLRYGKKTWFEATSERLDGFDPTQAAAVVAYLQFASARDEFHRARIEEALRNYWQARLE